MGREVRMVPPGWQHPTEWGKDWRTGQPKLHHVALLKGSYTEALAEWDEAAAKWESGLRQDYSAYPVKAWMPKDADNTESYAEYAGARPQEADYMPAFLEGTATHLMMYETTSEGTPISPAFATAEELARWLADNNASAFGSSGATYEEWLSMAKRGWAPSAVMSSQGLQSGVSALTSI